MKLRESATHRDSPILEDIEDRRTCGLIQMLWLINNGSEEDLADNCLTFFKQSLDASYEKVPSCQADAITDAYNSFHFRILAAMKRWWKNTNPGAYTAYNAYGFCIQSVEVSAPTELNVCSARLYTRRVAQDFATSVSLHLSNQQQKTDLNYWLSHVYFNNTVCRDPSDPSDGSRIPNDLASKPGNSALTSFTSTRRILTLPWRFSVHIVRLCPPAAEPDPLGTHRGTGIRRPNIRSNKVVRYNPNSLVIGPTFGSDEWAKYRLVGRIAHSGAQSGESGHYTSEILRSGTNETKNYSFDRVSDVTWDSSTEFVDDVNCVLLEFERCE